MSDETVVETQVDNPETVTEYYARLGPVEGEARVSPKHAIMAYEEALDAYPWVFEGDDQAPVVYSRQVTPWTPVSPEQGGGNA